MMSLWKKWGLPGMALLLVACGANSTTVPVTVQLPLSKSTMFPSDLSKVSLTVSGSDMSSVTASQSSPFSGTISLSVNVPTGNDRTFACTGAVSSSTSTGYQGSTTTNVTSATTSVPVTMLYVNTALNSVAAVGNGPQISSVAMTYTSNTVSMDIGFDNAVSINSLVGIIELDTDNSTSTGRSPSIINQLKGSVDVTMPGGGDSYIIFQGIGSSYDAILYNSSDESQSVNITTTASGAQQITLSMSRTDFIQSIDSDISGKLNVLVGTKTSANDIVSPTNTANFTASSVAAGSTAGNQMVYNAGFDTSNL